MIMRHVRAYIAVPVGRLSWPISIHFVAVHATGVKNCQKPLKPPIFRVQGHSRLSVLAFLRSLSPVLVMISSMAVLIFNHFCVRRANNSRI